MGCVLFHFLSFDRPTDKLTYILLYLFFQASSGEPVSEDKGLMDGLAGRQDPVSAGGGDWKNEVKVNAPNAVITGIIYYYAVLY